MGTKEISFTQVVEVGCGIDVHKDLITATIRKRNDDLEAMEFNAFTSSLKSLRDWCKEEKVTHVAMESTFLYSKIKILLSQFLIDIPAEHI